MKQLTIYCTEELIGQVNQILHNAGIEEYIHMPGLYGNKLKTKGSFENLVALNFNRGDLLMLISVLSWVVFESTPSAPVRAGRPALRASGDRKRHGCR